MDTVAGMLVVLGVAWEDNAEAIIKAGAVLSAVAAFGRFLVVPVVRYFKRIEKAMSVVEHEFRPNNGSSLRDAIDRVEGVLSTMQNDLSTLAGRADALEDYITNPQEDE